ncbi:MAG: cohesin domain-containing protein [Steroidobacteraceae bacterium]
MNAMFSRLITITTIAILATCGLAGCASEKLHRDGLDAIESGQYEEGLRKLEDAVAQNPGNLTYKLDLHGRRENVIQKLIAIADKARADGKYDLAEQTYARVLAIDAGNDRAQRGRQLVKDDRRHADMIAKARIDVERRDYDQAEARLRTVLAENPGAAAANALRAEIDRLRGPRTVTPKLQSRDNRPVTLQFRDASTKMVFEVLARQTGINFIFDKDVKSDGKTTIFVQNVPVEQAISLILGQNALAQQVLSDNMVIIYPNVANKQKEYQDQIIKTFYIANSDPKRAMEMLKTMLNARTLFVDDRANAVIMRDTPEAIRMAERLLASIDVPEAEVMMEVEVLEITRSKLQQLGVRYPNQVTLNPTPLAGNPLVLRDLADQDDTTITVSNVPVTIDLRKETGITNILASPRIRARNGQEAKVLIGDRVPVITNSVTPTAGGTAVVTGNVQYVDVGLKLEVQPTIYPDNDVAIKVELEVSNIVREISNTNSGTLAYQIGTRTASTVLRLRDGETQILGGLISDQDRRDSSHIPGIGDLPVLGRLFGSNTTSADKKEIVLSITPRIIRAQPRAGSENTEFWYGTESSLRSAPLAAPAIQVGGGSASSSSVPATVAPPGSGSGTPDDATGDGGNSDDTATAPEPPTRPTLQLNGPGQVSVGQSFEVQFAVSNLRSVASVNAMLRFDPQVLELQGGTAGDLIPAEKGAEPQGAAGGGRAVFQVDGVELSGDGSLFTVQFKALQPRPQTMIAVQQFTANDAGGSLVGAMAPRPLIVVVAP